MVLSAAGVPGALDRFRRMRYKKGVPDSTDFLQESGV
jgi:hypothetical protein